MSNQIDIQVKPKEIVLTTLNARYIHTSFGLRYLYANLHELQERCHLLECTINERALDIVEKILSFQPRIVGFGIYIWNAEQSLTVIRLLKSLQPQLIIVIGGPEVSYEWDKQDIFQACDYLISGEGEASFYQLCQQLLTGQLPEQKYIAGVPPKVDELVLPYDLYSQHDIAHRVIYVEASRGCPFRCQFCLSSLDKKVRNFPLQPFLQELKKLLERGVRQFKFVDRTFNLAVNISSAILQFFLDNYVNGLFLHFEMVPDRFPQVLRKLIEQFPVGAVQFEVGIQTWNEDVAARIARRQNNQKIRENLRYLRKTGVHLHTDLIAGLPGEDFDSFASGFDQLIELGVQEIQVGILKRLRGAPIALHTKKWQMIYNPAPPYEILRNKDWSFAQLAQMRRFARYWDIFGNSGRFTRTLQVLFATESAFITFWTFSKWLYKESGQTHKLSLQRQIRLLFQFLTEAKKMVPQEAADILFDDYHRSTGKHHIPDVLRPFITPFRKRAENAALSHLPKRQKIHALTSAVE